MEQLITNQNPEQIKDIFTNQIISLSKKTPTNKEWTYSKIMEDLGIKVL